MVCLPLQPAAMLPVQKFLGSQISLTRLPNKRDASFPACDPPQTVSGRPIQDVQDDWEKGAISCFPEMKDKEGRTIMWLRTARLFKSGLSKNQIQRCFSLPLSSHPSILESSQEINHSANHPALLLIPIHFLHAAPHPQHRGRAPPLLILAIFISTTARMTVARS